MGVSLLPTLLGDNVRHHEERKHTFDGAAATAKGDGKDLASAATAKGDAEDTAPAETAEADPHGSKPHQQMEPGALGSPI